MFMKTAENNVTEKAKEESYKKGEVGSSSKGKEEFLTPKRQKALCLNRVYICEV